MEGNDVRIEQENLRTARIFIDDTEVKGVTDVKYSIGVNDTPVIKLEFIPETLNFDSEKLVNEIIKQINEKAKKR